MTKKEIKEKFGVNGYWTWASVPSKYVTRTAALKLGVEIPVDAKPDAIKDSSTVLDRNKTFALFLLKKYQKQLV